MEECCRKYFGEFPHNEDIVLNDLNVQYDGTYAVLVDLPSGSKQRIDVELDAGDEVTIPKMTLNENMLHNFVVLDPFGEKVIFNDGYTDECDKFSLKTYINQNVQCGQCQEDEGESSSYY